MNCPRCNAEMSCGWWCRTCMMTRDDAQWVVDFNKTMSKDHRQTAMCMAAFFVVVLGVIALIRLGVGEVHYTHKPHRVLTERLEP